MDLNGIDQREPISSERSWSKAERQEDARLHEAAQQFEGLLLGIMLKESLGNNSVSAPDEDAATGFDQFREFCVEQVASSLSSSASMGIADQLYEQMKQQGGLP